MIDKAGTILINKHNIALVYRDFNDDYTFPKGHVEKGESFLECAIRETNEETKREVSLLMEEPIYIEEYKNSIGENCLCQYYLVRDNGHSDNKSEEVHDLIWTDFNKVGSVLSYKSQIKMWNEIKDIVEKYLED